MKRIIGIIVIAFFVGNSFAQNISQSNIPAVVLNSFQLKFPNAEDVSWKLEHGNYRIKFEVNSKINDLYLDYKGNIIKYHQDLWGSEVPEKVLNTIKSKVKYFDLNDADLVKDGHDIVYEINFEIERKDHDFWIDEKGKLLKYRKQLNSSEIPLSITSLINKKYGKLSIKQAKYVEEDGKVIYIIRGNINDSYHMFTLDDKATVLKHTQDLPNREIPVAIIKSMKKSYDGYEIRDADLLDENGRVIYVLRIKKSRHQAYVTFNPDGKILEVK